MKNWQAILKKWRQKPFIKQLQNGLPQAEFFLVGGTVRDAILERETKDTDIIIRGVAKSKLEAALAKLGAVNFVGKKFGVYKFKPHGWRGTEIDIALPRTEHVIKGSGAYKDFTITSDSSLPIEDDLSRRDFTINAMAWNILENRLIDPFGGAKDLQAKKIKAVGKPEQRFAEDYSRMLRAVRFAVQLNFELESKTKASLKKLVPKINKKVGGDFVVPREVIAAELNKTLTSNPLKAIELLDGLGFLKILMPELLTMKKCLQPKEWHSEGDVWKHTMLALSQLQSKKFQKEFAGQKPSSETVWALLYHDCGKPQTKSKTDRIHFHNHDSVSTKIFAKTAAQLKLSAAGIGIAKVENIIAKHMLPAHIRKTGIKDTTIEKYFFNEQFPGTELLMVIFCDISASIRPNGKSDFSSYKKLMSQITRLKIKAAKNKKLPKPLITGHDLIGKLKLLPGPQFNVILEAVRESHLKGKIKSKKEALALAKKISLKKIA